MRKGENARNDLLKAACGMFDKNGYEAVSVKDITDALGWAKSLFYYYYPNKEELMRACAMYRAEELKARIDERITQAELTPPERLDRVLSCMGFWGGDAYDAAYALGNFFLPENLPWRVYLREQTAALLGNICAETIVQGMEDRTLFAADPAVAGECAVRLAEALAERLVPLLRDGSQESIHAAYDLVCGYRRVIEHLVEAPIGSLAIVNAQFLADTAKILSGQKSEEK